MRKLTEQETATILAALRFYQEHGQGEPMNRSDAIHDIATNDDRTISLDDSGIDELCEGLNFGLSVELPKDADAARLLDSLNQFLQDWEENEGKGDEEAKRLRANYIALRPYMAASPSLFSFVGMVARLNTEEELKALETEDISSDCIESLNSLIRRARELTGFGPAVEPGDATFEDAEGGAK